MAWFRLSSGLAPRIHSQRVCLVSHHTDHRLPETTVPHRWSADEEITVTARARQKRGFRELPHSRGFDSATVLLGRIKPTKHSQPQVGLHVRKVPARRTRPAVDTERSDSVLCLRHNHGPETLVVALVQERHIGSIQRAPEHSHVLDHADVGNNLAPDQTHAVVRNANVARSAHRPLACKLAIVVNVQVLPVVDAHDVLPSALGHGGRHSEAESLEPAAALANLQRSAGDCPDVLRVRGACVVPERPSLLALARRVKEGTHQPCASQQARLHREPRLDRDLLQRKLGGGLGSRHQAGQVVGNVQASVEDTVKLDRLDLVVAHDEVASRQGTAPSRPVPAALPPQFCRSCP
eukprot:1732984-Rhodomonas_salina.3